MMDNSLSSRSSFNAKLAHAQSTPAGVDGSGTSSSRTPPVTPKKTGKMLSIKVEMLDDTISIFQIQAKAVGSLLFDQVCKQLNLLEADYFGLEYQDANTRYWLDLEKPLQRQVGLSMVEPSMQFCVKFYTPDPAQLEEEYTRYLFCMQIKRDLMKSDLQCNDNTAALIISYIVQAECGDYSSDDYPDHTYLSSHKFVPHQDRELERKIMENHKKHIGQSPAEADVNLLETARRCELYGVKMHPAKDPDGVPLNLSVAHMGIVIFQNYTKINTFSWAKIRKISFKRKRFLIKLHPEGFGYYKDVVEFMFDGRNECKSFWKKCVEHHGFFRCTVVKKIPRQKTRVLSRGSSFRYSGRTQKQIVEFVRDNYVKRQTFQRSQSFRNTSSIHSSTVNVGSISAHPLLPSGEMAMAGSGASLSCGSMTLSGSLSPTNHQDIGLQATAIARSQQIPVDIHDPITISSDITSIESSHSPPPHRDHHDAAVSSAAIATMNTSTDDAENDEVDHKNSNGILVNGCRSPSPIIDSGIVYGNDIVIEIETNPTSRKMNGIVPNLYGGRFIHSDTNIDSPIAELRNLSLSRVNHTTDDHTMDTKRKRPSDRAYFIAKELLATERTYRKDLEVISFWLRDEFNKYEEMLSFEVIEHLLSLIDPIYDAHCVLLRDIELRLSNWEPPCVADILCVFFNSISLYDRYIEEHSIVLEEIASTFRSNMKFEAVYKDFESQKVCYLPLTAFILKPLQRLLHYLQLLDRLIKHYGKNNIYYDDCFQARFLLVKVAKRIPNIIRKSENTSLLYELSRDITGVDIYLTDRQFIRQGCLSKFSQRKGYQQRMFFLFSDLLLYAGRSGHLFKIHGQLPLSNVTIEERPDTPQQHSFSIYGGNRVVTVAANSAEEKDKWLEDLTGAIQQYKLNNNILNGDDNSSLYYFSLKSCNSADDIAEKNNESNLKSISVANQRSNTTVHVCWHRNTSTSMDDLLRSTENQLSGFLLRKFKNSNGWQKLWVVFTNFCLFFYKSFQEDSPLASLPLLGYSITTPTEKDGINKEFVFKLQFKNHVYFFRAESEYTFSRWMEVIGNTAENSGRLRLFSRKESANFELIR